MKEKLKNLVRAVWSSAPYRVVLFGLDALAFRLAKPVKHGGPYSVLLAPATGQNIGDQAMFDSVAHNTRGRIVAVVTAPSFVLRERAPHEQLDVLELPGLIHRPPLLRFTSVYRFARVVKGAERLIGTGADMLDGGHPHASLARLSLFRLGVLAGIETVIQGFSWKADAPRTVVVAIKGLSERAQVTPRDPVSTRRLQAAGVKRIVPASDAVFSFPAEEELYPELAAFVAAATAAETPVVLLNTSGLIARKTDLTTDYAKVIERLHADGARIVFLPHVLRPWDDDLIVSRRMHEAYGAEDDFLVDRRLTPAQIRRLAKSASFSITGRMHLAILSLSQETPAICLATHGKVEGLFEFFDLPQLVVEPEAGCGDLLTATAADILKRRSEISAQIASHLPRVRELSALNFPYAARETVAR